MPVLILILMLTHMFMFMLLLLLLLMQALSELLVRVSMAVMSMVAFMVMRMFMVMFIFMLLFMLPELVVQPGVLVVLVRHCNNVRILILRLVTCTSVSRAVPAARQSVQTRCNIGLAAASHFLTRTLAATADATQNTVDDAWQCTALFLPCCFTFMMLFVVCSGSRTRHTCCHIGACNIYKQQPHKQSHRAITCCASASGANFVNPAQQPRFRKGAQGMMTALCRRRLLTVCAAITGGLMCQHCCGSHISWLANAGGGVGVLSCCCAHHHPPADAQQQQAYRRAGMPPTAAHSTDCCPWA